MLQDILQREDTAELLKEVVNNNRYNNKDDISSINYQQFNNTEHSLFITLEAIYKYKIIIDEESLLKDFIYQLNLLIRKIDNFHDIQDGVNRLITKFCILKLGYKDKEDKKRKEIIKYVYDKYINNGYFFHAINDVYKEDIKKQGLIPQQYKNLYDKFIDIKNILGSDVISKEFLSKNIHFTDSFMMSYYYAVNSPMYFYELLCDNKIINDREAQESYLENDYDKCNKNINKLVNKLELNDKNSDKVKEVFNSEWNLINKSSSRPTIIRVKRSLFMKDDSKEEEIYNNVINNTDIELSDAVGRILESKDDDIECSFKIDSKNIEFIDLPNYASLIEKRDVDHSVKKTEEESQPNNELGMISILMLIGSILIAAGVIMTMIVSGG